MAKTIPDDVAASLSFLESSAKPLDKIPAAPVIRKDVPRSKTGMPDDVAASLAVLEGKPVPEFQPADTGPTPRQLEADVLGLAIRKGIKSDTALAAHRRDVATKAGVNPGLVTPQGEDTAFYKEHDPEDLIKNFPAVAKYLGVQGNSELVGKDIGHLKTLETFFRRAVQDPEIVAAKGFVAAAQSLVGIADLNPADLGGLGKTLEDKGVDFDKISKVLTELYTPEMQASIKGLQAGEGFLGTLEAAAKNPAAVGELIGTSLPSIYLGGTLARAMMPALPAIAAVPIGEGLTMAGSSAEQIRAQDPNKELDYKQALLAAGVGVAGAGISFIGAKFAQKIGIEDLDMAIATGQLSNTLQKSGMPPPVAARLLGGFVSEGIVEELPQGLTEQIAQNVALGRPWGEGVPEAAALSIVTGGTMGAVVQAGVPARKQDTSKDGPLRKAIDAHLNDIGKAVSAEEQQAALQKWSEEITNNKLRKESPSAFKEFIKTMADEHSGIKEVFIDAKHLEESLQQSGIKPEEFVKNMPEVARDLQTALATGGEVRIPIEDYATYLAGSKLEPMILNQLRTDPEGMTYSESQTFFQQQKEIFAEKAKEIITTSQPVLTREEFALKPQNDGKEYTEYLKAHENKVEAFARDAQEVHDKILTGMNSAKRFNRAVNVVYAVPFREFYAVNAAKEGILPSELYARLPLNFSKMQIEGGGLEQAPTRTVKEPSSFNPTVATPDSFTKENVANLINTKNWAIFTAENPGGVTQDATLNAEANAKLRAELDSLGLKYEVVFGMYPGDAVEAESYIVYDIRQKQAHEIGNKYGQDSVLTREGLVYHDGSVTPPMGVITFDQVEQASKTGYTRVPRTGAIFTFDLDWSREKAARQGEMTVSGRHYSQEQRAALEGTRFGTGLPGAEGERVAESDDPRLKTRVAFYVDTGKGIKPEAGLGAVEHDVVLSNIYDASTNPLGFSYPSDRLGGNVFEQQVLDAGYDGYYSKFGDQGAVVVLGDAAKSIRTDNGQGRDEGVLRSQTGQDTGAREADGSLQGLPRKVGEFNAKHYQKAEEITRKYMAEAGLPYNPPSTYAKVDPVRAKRVADAFDQMKHDPQNPEIKAAYDALVKETTAQYKAVIDSGLEVEFIDFNKTGDPYEGNPRKMTEDVINNNHMWVFSTREGFGSDADFNPQDNPLLAETDFEISGQKALANDLFRVVHDYFGHVKEGVGFRAEGEENAWRAHMSMFSPLAGRALTTETRGQNSWVNFGPFAESNKTASAADTHYADQKIGLLPEWASTEGAKDEVLNQSAVLPETINVDGVERTTLNSEGRPIYPTEEGIRNFWKWFGDSKVVDEQGRPKVVYHGSPKVGFTEFYVGNVGAFFTDRFDIAASYAGRYNEVEIGDTKGLSADEGQGVYGVYLKIATPSVVDFKGASWGNGPDKLTIDDIANKARQSSNDGVIADNVADSGYLSPGIVEGDDVGTNFVVFNSDQIKSAIGNNGDFSSDPNILKQSAFYSALEREIPNLRKVAGKDGNIKPEQAKAWIEARQKEGKFKKEEIEAVGLMDWLDTQGGKVPVADIENFVRENGVRIDETVLGGTATPIAVQEYEDQPEIYTLYRSDDPEGQNYGALGEIIQIEDGQYEINVPGFTGRVTFDTLQEALERVSRGSSQFSETKFYDYVLPGGENYRELLLTLPDTKEQQRSAMNASYRALRDSVKERLKGHAGFNLYDARDQGKLTPEEATRLEAIDAEGKRVDKLPKPFSSAHFDQTNILAHVRVNERIVIEPLTSEEIEATKQNVVLEGKIQKLRNEQATVSREITKELKPIREEIAKRLREEAIASNDSAKLAQVPFATEDEMQARPPTANQERLAQLRSEEDALRKQQVKIADHRKKVLFVEEIQSDWAQQGRDRGFKKDDVLSEAELSRKKELSAFLRTASVDNEGIEVIRNAQEELDAIKLRENVNGTPSGPFVQNTKSWTALAVKRLMRYAAENGFDKIAWTTGEQQANRYREALLAVVDEVRYKKNEDGTFTFVPYKDGNGIHKFEEANVSKARVTEVLGKDIASKMEDGVGRSEGGVNVLTGLDLEIGGEGMKAFYDQIVPQVVNDVSKKLGGGKVGSVALISEQANQTEKDFLKWAETNQPGMPENVLRRMWQKGDADETVRKFKGENGAAAQHSLDITPEMRDKIMQGLPLFQGNRAGFNPNTFTMTLLDGSDLSSVIHEGGHFYLEALNEMATRPEAPQQIKDDFRKTLEWFGITGNEVGMPGGDLLDQKAFHGSPHDHNKFDSSKIGTGEGAQAYGYGHYFAESKDIAEYYKEKLTEDRLVSINNASIYVVSGENVVQGTYEYADGTSRQSPWLEEKELSELIGKEKAKEIFDNATLEDENLDVINTSKLYEVELAPEQDEYLLWDKPLSEQSDKVKAALRDYVALNPGGMIAEMLSPLERTSTNGDALYRAFVRQARETLGTTGKGLQDNAARKASEMLHFLGIRGIKYLDGTSRGAGEGSYNYVIFSDEDITITDKYYQGGETPQPGQLPPGRTPEEIWNAMTLDQKRPYHEQWAQSWERYALEGKAPTLEMQPVFARFRAWMLNIYKSMKEFLRNNPLAGKLNDDIRAVFDRLIASEEAIAEAQKARSYAPLFATSEEAGVTDKQFQEYVDEGRRAADEATSELDARSIRDMKWLTGARTKALKSLQAEARTKRKMMRTEVEQDIAQEPVERAKSYFTKGEYVNDRGEVIEAEVKAKLNKAEVRELMPNIDMQKLRGMTSDDGIALDLAAQLTGFGSGEALIKALNDSEPTRDKVAAEVDKRMLEQYGDLVDDNALSAAADEAVHNEARARFMATGLKMLLKTSATSSQLVKAAKQAAEQAIAGKAIRDIRPGQYARAETKANKEALKRAPKDRAGAAEAQRAALLNNKLYSVARDAQNEVNSILKYVRKFDNRKLGKVIHHDYLEQIVDLLSPFEFKNLPLRQIDKNKSLAAWVEEQEANGFQPAIDVDTIEKSKLKHYKDMTLEELRGLKDTIKQVEHLGRYKDKLLTAKDRREFNERMLEAEDSIRENANRTVEERATPTDTLGKTGQWFRQMSAGHRKFSSIIREMDGGKDNGAMWNLLARAMNEAGDMETEMRQQAAEKVATLFKMIELDQGFMNLSAKKRLVPGTDISMTHEQRIMFAMNWGNEGNRQRLLDGGITGRRALSVLQAQSILDTLTKPEWDFVQATWDYVGTYKEQIAALERKMTGVEPLWIEPAPTETKFGTYAGGYFPAKYDAELSTRSESLEAVTDLRMGMKGAFGAAATRNGYTQERSKQVIGRPLLLSFNVIPQHVNEVIHRLSWQPWLTDANRVLRHLDSPIREHYGTEILREMRDTVMDIATGDAPAKNATEAAINRLRMGSTIVGMGWRVTTALLQPSGLAQSYVRVGPKWVSQGILQFLTSPNDSAKFADSRSTFMKNRATTMNREINEVLNTLRTGEGVSNLTASYFWLIAKMQRTVDIPTWIGAYNKGLAEVGYENAVDEAQRKTMEDHAVRLADQAVIDSQSSGMTKDLARVQRGSPLNKILTNFYSYFSATYNLNIETVRKTNFMKPAEVMLMANNLIVLNVLPVLFAVALKEATKGNCGDDLECLAGKLANEQISYLLGQMILLREIGAAVGVATGGDQYGYQGPAGLRFFGDLYKAGVQVNQGELDAPFWKSINNVGGAVLHYPAGQINATFIDGIMAIENGDVEGVSILPALLFGPPKD